MLSCVKYQTSYEFACGFHVHDYYLFFLNDYFVVLPFDLSLTI